MPRFMGKQITIDKNLYIMANITVVLEGFLYFVLLRFLLAGTLSQLNRLGILQGIINAIIYYILIISIAIFVGRRVAKKAPNKKVFSAFIAVILYTLASLAAFFVNIYIKEFIIISCINILCCLLAAYFEAKREII